MKQYASIFNDVIGPVMRGPSSSHTAGSIRIGKLLRQMIKGKPIAFCADFHPEGSLATTYHTQGSDIGLIGGLLGMDTEDERLINALDIAAERNIDVKFNIVKFEADHPNTYRMSIKSDIGEEISVTALSVGGGMVELTIINGFDVFITGGFYETLLFFENIDEDILNEYKDEIEKGINSSHICGISLKGNNGLINIKTSEELLKSIVEGYVKRFNIDTAIQLSPVLPVLSQLVPQVPFKNAEEMVKLANKENLDLWELAIRYESVRGNITEDKVLSMMRKIVNIMKVSVDKGLDGTEYRNRILGPQAWKIKKAEEKERLIGDNITNVIISSITSVMEVKSSMGVIVAAPTAGSCGILPGTIIGVAREIGLNGLDVIKAMLAAGIIGVLIAENATFAAEVGGCQAECGSGSGMAAAGLVQLMGGTTQTAADAASMALQNVMGMVCDPVAGGVEVPCLGKNVMSGLNAVASANMALAGFDKVIPLDETIDAIYKVGRMLPYELRCTGYGGLSITRTAQEICKKLK